MRGVVEDFGRFDHFDHEGGAPGMQFIMRPDAGENAVDQADFAPAVAGTKLPIWAMSVMSATWRK